MKTRKKVKRSLALLLAFALMLSNVAFATDGTLGQGSDPVATASEPAVSEPATQEPAAPEPAISEPAAPEPAAPEPATPEPTTPEPPAPEPVAPEPAAPEPVGPEPATPEPTTPEPAAPKTDPVVEGNTLPVTPQEETYMVDFLVTNTEGGTVRIDGALIGKQASKTVKNNETIRFSIVENEGYVTKSVKVNGVVIEAIADTTYEVKEITEPKSVVIEFEEAKIVTPQAPVNKVAPEVTAESLPTEPAIYNLQVYFEYEDGTQAINMYNGQYENGTTYDITVPSLSGYIPTVNMVPVMNGKLNGTIEQDTSITVIYQAQETTYKVNHYIQNLAGTYDLNQEELTAKVGTTTTATAKILTGYTSTAFSQKTVVADENITIDIYYNLEKHYVTFNINGGSYVPRILAKYGEVITIPGTTPTKNGYTFGGWYTNSGLTGVPITGTLTITSDVNLYAKWNPVNVGYTVVYWQEGLVSGQYVYKESVAKTGLAGTLVSGVGDKSYTYFSYNDVATDKNIAINPNGTTVVNVYYTRNIYTFLFNLDNSRANLTINGTTYTGTGYSFQAKFGQDISTKWPTASNIGTASGTVNQTNRFESWNGQWVTKRFTVTAELISNTAANTTQTMVAVWNSSLRLVSVHYWLENADNSNYTEATAYTQTVNISGGLGAKEIEGFTYSYSNNTGGTGDNATNYNFYYSRDRHTLSFSSGGSIITAKTESIKFDANISAKAFVPDHPTNIPFYYHFVGWYATPQGYESSLFTFANAKMPSSNLLLYAKWAAFVYEITFDTQGGSAVTPQQVVGGQSASAPMIPTREGYIFEGWYSSNNYTQEYDFAAPVTGNTTIYAKWTPITETTYTVEYKLEDGTTIFPTKTISGFVGDRVYAVALAHSTYIVDKVKDSLVLSHDKTENVITFTYSTMSTVYYKVIYKNIDGIVLREEVAQPTNQNQIVVTSNPPVGYAATVSRITKILENEKTPEAVNHNIIIFTCNPLNYVITYHLNDGSVAGTNPTTYTIESSKITLINPTKAGYIFQGWSGTGLMGNSNLNVEISAGSMGNRSYTAYWIPRVDLSYIVTYEDTLGTELHQPKTVLNQTMGTQVTETAVAIEGFTPDQVTKTITIEAINNKISFIYSRNNQTYKVKYVDEDTNNQIANEDSFSAKYGDFITGSTKQILIPDYVYSNATDLTVGANNATNIITVSYLVDKIGVQDPDEPDGIPDKYQILFEYKGGANGSVSGTLKEVVNRTGLTTTGSATPNANVSATADTGSHFVNWTADAQAYADVQAIRAASFTQNTIFTANFRTNYKLTITANSATRAYNGQPLMEIGYTSQGLRSGDVVTNISTSGSQKDVGFSDNSITGTAIILDEQGHNVTYMYQIEMQSGSLVVTTKEVTLTADNKSKIYGEADPQLTATGEGIIAGDALDYTLIRESGEDVGSYDINVTMGSNPNYQITVVPGTFTIEKKSIGMAIIADNQTKVYGQADPQLTAMVTGLIGNDSLDYSLSREAGEDVGSYEITIILGSNPNYEVEDITSGTFTITPKDITLVIDNKSKVYGSVDPQLTATVNGLVGNDNLNYNLEREVGENVGNYQITANITANPNYTVTVTEAMLTITKKTAEVMVIADAATKVYGEDDQVLTATVTGVEGTDTLNYTLTREPGEDVGTYNIIVTLGNNPNYEVGTMNATFTITQKPITMNALSKEKEYGSLDPELTAEVTGALAGEMIHYTISREPGEDAGTYAITIHVGDNPNYSIITTDGTFKINKKDATIQANDGGKIYNDVDPELSAQVMGLVGTDSLDYSVDRTPGEDVGMYSITISALENQNYNITTIPATFVIVKRVIGVQVIAQDANKIYGNPDPELRADVFGIKSGDTLNYTISREVGENVGTYTISVVAGVNTNYDIEILAPAMFSILPKEVTVAADDSSKVYGDSDPILTATVTGAIAGETLDYTLVRESGENVGEYSIHVITAMNSNYTVMVVDGAFSIYKKEANVRITPDDKGKVYGEMDPALSAQVSGTVGDDVLNYTLSREAGEDVGTYSIHVILGMNPNYEIGISEGTFVIDKKEIALIIADAHKTYGDVEPVLSATADVVGSDTLDYSLSREAGEDVGSYLIHATLGTNPNYDVTVTDGNFTITKKAITLIVDNNTKTYGDLDPVWTAAATDLVVGDSLDYTLSREMGENVGTYLISATLGTNPNYDISTVVGNFSITPKEVDVTIVADNQSKTYGDADPVLTAKKNGMVGMDTLDYTISREAGEDVGTYEIYIIPGYNPNYVVATTNGQMVILAKEVTIIANDSGKVYGDIDPILTATPIGVIAGDTLDYTVSRTMGEDAGMYIIQVYPEANVNYTITTVDGTFTIDKKSLGVEVIADNSSKVYGNTDPVFVAQAIGTVGSDTLNYNLYRDGGEQVGDYVIHVVLGTNPNYNIEPRDGIFTIHKKTVTVTMDNDSKIYGQPDPDLTPLIAGLMPGDTLAYTIIREQGEIPGLYDDTAVIGNNPNYEVTVVDGILVISKKPVTLVVDNKNKVYGEVDPTLSATVADLVIGDTLDYTLVRTPGEDVGNYQITAVLGSNPYYEVTVLDAIITINPKEIGVSIVAKNQTKTYGEADPTLSAQAIGMLSGDVLNYTITRDSGENVGVYDIHVTLGNNPNYLITITTGQLTVLPKAITITVANSGKLVGSADPTLVATVNGVVGNDKINYTVIRDSGEKVGVYKIKALHSNNPNYKVTTTDGIFVIMEEAITPTPEKKLIPEQKPTQPKVTQKEVKQESVRSTESSSPEVKGESIQNDKHSDEKVPIIKIKEEQRECCILHLLILLLALTIEIIYTRSMKKHQAKIFALREEIAFGKKPDN